MNGFLDLVGLITIGLLTAVAMRLLYLATRTR